MVRWLCLTGLVATVWPVAGLKGQIIRGKVVEFRSDKPVEGAQISLLDSKKRELEASARTDSLGEFQIRVPAPGRYIVKARRLGYEEFLSVPKDVKANDTVRVNLWPEANGQLLDSILSLDTRDPTTRVKGFSARRRDGHGQFITRGTIIAARYRDLEDALANGIPGMDVRRGNGEAMLCYRGCCSFAIYHNGLPTLSTGNASAAGRQLDDALTKRGPNLYGIEVFVGRNQIPMEYRDAGRAHCGVMAYWTHSPN